MAKTETLQRNEASGRLLDVPILSVLHVNLEVLLYILLGILAVIACFTNLGARAQSHDESLHALYSWKLYAGEGYEHNPMMHGPFLFHINALFYFLFGTSDFTARISAAIFGVILVLLPVFLRKELGRVGALIVSALTLISPSILYYARYIRNDIYMMVWAMLMAIALFRYLDSRKPGWLYLGVLAVTLSMTTKETAYITGFIGFTFVIMLWIQQMLSQKATRRAYVVGAAFTILLVVVMIALNVYKDTLPMASPDSAEEQAGLTQQTIQKVIEVIFLLVGILVTMLLGSVLMRHDERLKPALKLMAAYVIAIVALMVICAAAGGLVWLIVAQLPEGIVSPPVFLVLQVALVGVAVAAGAYLWWRLLNDARDRGWLPGPTEVGPGFQNKVLYISLALAVIPFVLLYTTFFTNPKGLGTGTFGAIAYWLAQQEVKRAGQPWYYYFVVAPLYDFVPIGFGLAAMAYYFVTGKVDRLAEQAQAAEGEARPSLPFVSYAVYWTLSSWLIYSWAGEKMPWMMVHVVQPMIVLTGRFADDMLYGVDWRQVWRRGGAILALLVPLILVAAGMVVGLPLFGQAFKGLSLGDLDDTSKWLFALVIGGALVYLASRLWRKLGRSASWRVVFVSLLALGSLLTIRFAWMAAYINYDTAKEFLVYAHGTTDVKQTVKEIQEISRRLYGDENSIKFAYSSDATWPFEWYFDTLFPNRVFFGREPTREATNVPVLVIGREEMSKTEPFLGTRYHCFDRKLVWWPHQDYYMGLSLAVPPEQDREPGKDYLLLDLQDPEKRRELWNVLFYRKYEQSLADWEPSHAFSFCVRKDVAAQLWDYGVAPTAVDLSGDEDLYAKGQRPLTSVSAWGGSGMGEGRFNNPRNIAIGPDGSVYVADGGNHRIQKFTADGEYVTAWGHACRMYEGQAGCQSADGAGGLYDPWGIAVDQDGYVYVADTWNHRIQKFDSDGAFVTMWGEHGVNEDATGGEGLLWGPRAIAVDPQGQIYVTDTGNKRVQVFTPDGQFVTQFGGRGLQDGRMDEPVGIAIDPGGNTYVADTWNQRIQVFDALQMFLRNWEVDSWYGQSLENKPYLALDAQNRIYATDPEGYRILVFDDAGRFLASLGRYGTEDDAFMLPTGIAVDPQGYIYVVDTATHRVMKFAPFE
jgi:uncharacterized protein (TIGR03663 family)